jgi:hypothetical protein
LRWRQTASFIENSTEAGILLGGRKYREPLLLVVKANSEQASILPPSHRPRRARLSVRVTQLPRAFLLEEHSPSALLANAGRDSTDVSETSPRRLRARPVQRTARITCGVDLETEKRGLKHVLLWIGADQESAQRPRAARRNPSGRQPALARARPRPPAGRHGVRTSASARPPPVQAHAARARASIGRQAARSAGPALASRARSERVHVEAARGAMTREGLRAHAWQPGHTPSTRARRARVVALRPLRSRSRRDQAARASPAAHAARTRAGGGRSPGQTRHGPPSLAAARSRTSCVRPQAWSRQGPGRCRCGAAAVRGSRPGARAPRQHRLGLRIGIIGSLALRCAGT